MNNINNYQYDTIMVEKSYCCNYDAAWVKGSYMGSGYWECCRCEKPCKIYEAEIKVFVRPKSPKNFKPYI